MNKLSYSNFDISNGDIAFASTNGYGKPSGELEIRKQFSFPLKELKTFINNVVSVDSEDTVIQLVIDANGNLKYRTDPSANLQDISVSGSIPSGGTSGQILQKNSSTDFDASWTSPQKMVVLTKTAYEALGTKDSTTLYFAYEE